MDGRNPAPGRARSPDYARLVYPLLVHALYKAAFGRPADEAGLAVHAERLRAGTPLEELAEDLARSAEFQARHGPGPTVDPDYVAALYRNGLGREPDPEGLAHWLAEAQKGATRAQVLAAVAQSEEALGKALQKAPERARPEPSAGDYLRWVTLVHSLYHTAFGRPADEAGLAVHAERLRAGTPLEELAEDLARSAEFQARHGPGPAVDPDYVAALYRNGLGREPDPEGLAHWLAEAQKGTTRAQVLAAVADSGEARDSFAFVKRAMSDGRNPSAGDARSPDYARLVYPLLVHALYKAAFGRPADEAGLAVHAERLRAGTPLEELAEDLTRCEEFQARHGPGPAVDADYVAALYRNGLGREPDPEGLAHWLAEAQKGATRAQVLAAVSQSEQALGNALQKAPEPSDEDRLRWATLVHSLYHTAFGRPADEAGLAVHAERLRAGTPLEELAEDLARSAEFQARHGPGPAVDADYVAALYRNGCRRKPELERLAFWLTAGEGGATRAKALAAIARSEEALERFSPPDRDEIAAYQTWVSRYDTISDTDRSVIRAHLGTLPYQPVISVVLILGKASAAGFKESVTSVMTQLYPHWELCVALDEKTGPLMETILGAGTPADPRVRVARSDSFSGAAAAGNAALEVATGEFVTFLHADDRLAEHALYEVAFALGERGRTDILYSDQDRLTPQGQRSDPWFKPGWDPDLLLGHDYVSNLAVYRRDLLEAIGFLRPGLEGAEFHDLALRATAATEPGRITHVPAILYHARQIAAASDPETGAATLRAASASRRAIREHLHAHGYPAALVGPAPQMPQATRITWPLTTPEPLVSVIIPTRDRADLLAECIDGVLHRTDYRNLELLIVDNESAEPSTHALLDRLSREERAVRVLRSPGRFNYSALNNMAAKEARGEILLLLNNDVMVIEPGWLREMVSNVLRPDVGVVGAKLLYADGRVQHGGIVLGPEGSVIHAHRQADRNCPGYFGQLALLRTLSAVTGACAAVRRAVFFEVGGLDEVNLPVSFNDIDFCLRIADHGYRVVWTPFAELFHLESASRGQDDSDPGKQNRYLREFQHMRQTWGALVDSADPFHNPNLLFAWEYFQMPSPPRREKPWYRFFTEAYALKGCLAPAEDLQVLTNRSAAN